MKERKNLETTDESELDDAHREIANEAREYGHIKIIDLVSILASKISDTAILSKLQEIFFPNTCQNRIVSWLGLIIRWVGLSSYATRQKQKDLKYLNCYRFDRIKGDWSQVVRDKFNPNIKQDYFDGYINLIEFKKYVEGLNRIHEFSIQLPQLLYQDSEANKKLRPDQQAKEAVQGVARNLWDKEKLKIGIKEMCDRDDILNAGGKHYQPNTVRKWISEVAPLWAKRPGRRKAT